MFFGSVPRALASSIVQTIDMTRAPAVYVGCSSDFRVETALHAGGCKAPVISNGVNAVTCALGWLSSGDNRLRDVHFGGDVAWLEDAVDASLIQRAAGVLIARSVLRHDTSTVYGRRAVDRMRRDPTAIVGKMAGRLGGWLKRVSVAEFIAGDVRDHAQRAIEAGGVFIAAEPSDARYWTRHYRPLHQSIGWHDVRRPRFDREADTLELIHRLLDAGIPFAIVSEREFDAPLVAAMHRKGAPPIYAYGRARRMAYRRQRKAFAPVMYEPIDVDRITRDSRVEIRPIPARHMAYLRARYMPMSVDSGIDKHNFAVLIDGMLAGCIGYAYRDADGCHYLMIDFSTSRRCRLAKLIALLATSREVVHQVERRMLYRLREIETVVLTDRPSSAKYRGIYHLKERKEGRLVYVSWVREQTVKELYQYWFDRWAARAPDAPRSARAQAA